MLRNQQDYTPARHQKNYDQLQQVGCGDTPQLMEMEFVCPPIQMHIIAKLSII